MKKNKKIEVSQAEQTVAHKSNRILFLLIGFLTFFVFANTIGNDYNMDDELVTRNHPLTSQGLKAVTEIFTSPYYKDDMGYAYGYRPIVHLSFALEHELFGEKASISHFINVILYVTCVLLFLNLLLKWVGEKNKWIAIISVLFFALHPIHTEVVASIKNRDELLAFMFAMLSALSMIKYIEKEKWINLFWIALFIALGMLSKKSIYPLTVILPISAVLLHSITWKNLACIVLAFSVPSAIISSESTVSKFSLFLMIPWLGSFVLFYFKEKLFSDEPFFKSVYNDFNFWAITTLFISFYGFYTLSYYAIPFIVFLSFVCFFKFNEKGIILFSLTTTILGLRYDYLEFSYFGFILLTNYYFINYIFKEKKSNLLLSLITFNLLIIWIINPSLNQMFSLIIIYSFFILLLKKKTIFGLILNVLILVLSYMINQSINSIGIVLLPFSFLLFVGDFFGLVRFKKLIPLFAIISVFFITGIAENIVKQKIEPPQFEFNKNGVVQNAQTQSLLLEGRHLEYVENTLVEKHSTSETIGTGLSIMGTYSKLMVFPYELSFYYGFSKIKTVGLNDYKVWISFLFHLGLIVLALLKLKSQPILTIGVGWYLLSILLFSSWFELVAGMVGERLAFTASAGFSIFIAALLFWLKPDINFKRPKIFEFSIIIVFILFSVKSISRNSQWKNQITLMSNDIKHLQNSAQANNLYALNLMKISTSEENYSQEQRFEMQKIAVDHFKKAVEIYPKFKNAWFDLGRSALITNDLRNAVLGFSKSIELNPSYSEAYFMLCDIYVTQNNKKLFLKTAKSLYKIDKSQKAYVILTDAFFINGLKDDANQLLNKALKKFPNDNNLLLLFDKINL